ncbi:HAD family hydrolase [Litchfieldia alkalitelluris]|uniref:HAD family hydrolase n=1 Tax=Litchfieldia alkalitelluris TaxID=304268 RepID=UPI001472763E|nr:HAD family hydrolase [Litchfieldia alkalitelluris]
MKWELICFDLDNTLFDYERTFERTMKHCFEKLSVQFNYKITSEEWFPAFKKYCDLDWVKFETEHWTKEQYYENRFLDTMNELSLPAKIEVANCLQTEFNKNVHHFIVPFKGTKHLLLYLRHHFNGPLGIITNGRTKIQQAKIKALELNTFFKEKSIFISEELKLAKPDKSIFQFVNQHMKVSGDKSLYIGDSWELDIKGAISAEWDAIYFNTRGEKAQKTVPHVPQCNTINEIISILEK